MRLVHLSDLHLGFRAYWTVERGWNQRERDLAAAFRFALQETVRLRPDLVLVTGDVFDDPSPPSTAFLTFHRGIAHLQAHLPGVSVLVIAGERDTPRNAAHPGPVAVLDALPGVEAAAGSARAVRFRRTGVHALLVPFRAAAGLAHPDIRPDPAARWNLLLIRGDPATVTPALNLDPAEWSYVAIGGDHHARAWETNVRASGALERPRTSPWQEAAEERGFLSFDLEHGVAEFHPVPGRPVVDLAPVRVERDDIEAGTRRLRELLQGVPGGVEGKILRIRLRGDVISPGEGVSQGLLDAVRRRAAHLELQVESPDRPSSSGVAGREPWSVKEIAFPGSDPLEVGGRSGARRITLLTSDTEASRLDLVEAFRGRSQSEGLGSGQRVGLRVIPHPPGDPVSMGVWAGAADSVLLLRTVLGGSMAGAPANVARNDAVGEGPLEDPGTGQDESPSEGNGGAKWQSIASLEAELVERRGDWVEASGDLDAETLQWAQERQDADSKLHAYRDRAAELRTRMRALESEKEDAACPTCGRPLGGDFAHLLQTLRGEWENVVQDGRWWKRRREQLDVKSETLRKLEEHALRLQMEVETSAEALERMRERVAVEKFALPGKVQAGRLGQSEGSVDPEWARKPVARDVLRLAGSFVHRITEGRIVGVKLEEKLQVVGVDGRRRSPVGDENAALRLAVHLALWSHREACGSRVESLLVWELHELGSLGLLRGTLELLSDPDRFPVPILIVAPPEATEREPELLSQAIETRVDGQDRQEIRVSPLGPPAIRLSAEGARGRQVS